MELDQAIEAWYLQQVENVKLDISAQAEITKAGAEEFKKALYNATPVYENHSKHARDTIVVQSKDIDGDFNGKSTVGYSEEGKKAYLMRFMNDGTKFYPKKGSEHNHLGFYNKLLDSPKVQADILNAEASAYHAIMKGKNKDE